MVQCIYTNFYNIRENSDFYKCDLTFYLYTYVLSYIIIRFSFYKNKTHNRSWISIKKDSLSTYMHTLSDFEVKIYLLCAYKEEYNNSECIMYCSFAKKEKKNFYQLNTTNSTDSKKIKKNLCASLFDYFKNWMSFFLYFVYRLFLWCSIRFI